MIKENSTQEKKSFGAEVDKILHLMIHSLYAHKDIFVRELISNASDACDKLRYLSQTNTGLLSDGADFKITISLDKEKKTITIRDTGIGMNKGDLIENLGTIARSGTQEFAKLLSGNSKKDSLLIGQFGVGFYSAFMVADSIFVTSKKAGEDKAYTWYSEGEASYFVSETDREFSRGTEIVLNIKDSETSFLDHFRLKHIVNTYSDHIAVPIYFVEEGKTEVQLNSSSALWTKSKSEVTQEQYKEFYKTIAYAADDPWITMHNRNEGAVEFTNLLFIPSSKTFDLFHPDRKIRVKLYIKRVFISDENIDLVPAYLRFLRGIVDSEDLPLNISRETLQHNATLEKIKNSITKRVISELKQKKDNAFEEYNEFWKNFGGVLKEGLCEATSDHEKLLEVCIFRSAKHDKLVSLDDYIANCKEGQKTIYYLSGNDADKLKSSPQIEGFLNRDIDVLLFTDTVDDFWVNVNSKYKDYNIKSVTRSNIDLDNAGDVKGDTDKEKKAQSQDSDYSKLIAYFKENLADLVKEVKVTKKLASSPACLAVGEGSMDIRMERFLIEQKQLAASTAKILEINPNHSIIKKIQNDIEAGKGDEENKNLVRLIFDQACIIEGEPVPDVAGFSKRLNSVLEKAL